MEESNLSLLLQLVRNIESKSEVLEKAYNVSNKEDFDRAKKEIMEISSKINIVLKK